MANETKTSLQSLPAQAPDRVLKQSPTLFIGLGGTGMEVMLRIRRRILNANWGSRHAPMRLDSVTEFPVAQFLHIDLDQRSLLDSGHSLSDDPQAPLVKFPEEDRLVEKLDLSKYSRSDEDLAKYEYIEPWCPLTPKAIRDSKIDTEKGAGQLRAISRLYFFDRYSQIRDRIHQKLIWLQSGLTKDAQLKAMGLELDQSNFRIVIIGSGAGGTGAGCFLDMGYLARWVAKQTVTSADVDLMLFMPSGYVKHNKERVEANGYAALMELETCELGGSNYVSQWDRYDRPELTDKPFSEVYLLDAGNLAQEHTTKLTDVFDMLADALFEDFGSVDFANKKRSVAVNQSQHKMLPFVPPVNARRFGAMRLAYYKGYSALGQSILDTQEQLLMDIRAYRWAASMMRAFFGVGAQDTRANRATDHQRDEFLEAQLHLATQTFGDLPDLSAKDVALHLAKREFTDYRLTDELLTDRHGSIVSGIQQKVDAALEQIMSAFERKEWGTQIRARLRELEADVMRDENAVADVSEDRVAHRAAQVFDEMTARLRNRLYELLDNKEFGGLEFVLSMVDQVKDRLENANTGIIAALTLNAKRYAELHNAVRTAELERLLKNLGQTGGLSLFGNSEKQAIEIVGQLKREIGNALKLHIRAKSAGAAAQLLTRVSKWLGERTDVDNRGVATWNGLVGELNGGRAAVESVVAEFDRRIGQLRTDADKDHATYIRLQTKRSDEIALPGVIDLRAWADDAFRDFGGSVSLFPMLAEPARRAKLMSKLLNKAIAQVIAAEAGTGDPVDPLVVALDAMSAGGRQRTFANFLARAMPWVDASWSKDFAPTPAQYKCFVGVGRVRDFEKYRLELIAQAPVNSGLVADYIQFVDSGIPGRAVCYVELSGIPLTALRGLETWRASYRKESEKFPLHTHRNFTQFTHPLVPTTAELAQLADDLGIFLTAVMLGIFTRDRSESAALPGLYHFQMGPGDLRRMGNERAFRQDGLPVVYRSQIVQSVEQKLDGLDARQLAALAALAAFYARDTYKAKLLLRKSNDVAEQAFPSKIAESLVTDFRERAARRGLTPTDVSRIETQAYETIGRWTEALENSDADAYPWEVADAVDTPRLKRVVRKQFLAAENFDTLVLGTPAIAAGAGAFGAAYPPPVGAVAPGMPPPPVVSFMLAVSGQTFGPYMPGQLLQMVSAGQFTPQSMVWRAGMTEWKPAMLLPELATLFAAPPADMPPPPPPPAA